MMILNYDFMIARIYKEGLHEVKLEVSWIRDLVKLKKTRGDIKL